MSLSRAEQETIIRFDRESPDMFMDTFSRAAAKKLLASGAQVHREWVRGGQACWTLKMPKTWFRLPRRRRTRKAILGENTTDVSGKTDGTGQG